MDGRRGGGSPIEAGRRSVRNYPQGPTVGPKYAGVANTVLGLPRQGMPPFFFPSPETPPSQTHVLPLPYPPPRLPPFHPHPSTLTLPPLLPAFPLCEQRSCTT